MTKKPDVVGIPDVADRLGVQRDTIHVWRQRAVMPEPDWMISDRPAWLWSTVKRWAKETGRI